MGGGDLWGEKKGRKRDEWKGKDMQSTKRYVMSFGLGRCVLVLASTLVVRVIICTATCKISGNLSDGIQW